MQSSIIIIVYNGISYLNRCIPSLIRVLDKGDEIVVIDNHSSDGSPDLVRQRWPQVRLICNRENRGFAAACNQGARAARGETLVFLNQDTEVLPGWLAGLLEALAEAPNGGLATSKLLLLSRPGRIHLCGQDIHFSGLPFGRGFLQSGEGYSNPGIVGAVSGAAFAIRRPLWERLGGFDEGLFMYYEETDLSWRAALAGYECRYTPRSVAYHDGRLRPSPDAFYYSARNRLALLLKHWKWATLLALLPGLLLAELVDWGYTLNFGRWGIAAKLKGYGWVLAHLPAILAARRQVQALRTQPDRVLLERCVARLAPRVITGGRLGRAAVAAANAALTLNYQAALGLAAWINL